MSDKRIVGSVLGVPIDALSWHHTIKRILSWAKENKSRYVAICNAHVIVTSMTDKAYLEVIKKADMATPDGAPVAWILRRLGFSHQPRISGPDLMIRLLWECANKGIPIYFYGSSEGTLMKLRKNMLLRFPDLKIAGMLSPPFRALNEKEDKEIVSQINSCGTSIVFVGLGCPKQELWMSEHRGRVRSVMIGVGAAFDFHAGTIKRAPGWMRDNGLEWLHRLMKEPGRLWKRYLVTNTLFFVKALLQTIKQK